MKDIKRLPFKFYYIPLLLASIAGFLDSLYLSLSHYRVYTDIGYKSFCAISKALNCDTVSQSEFSILFNRVPVPFLGLLAYSFLLFMVVYFRKKNRGWYFILSVSFLFSIYSVFLGVISGYYIHTYCIMCIFSYLINFILFFFSLLIVRRFFMGSFFKLLIEDFVLFFKTRTPLFSFLIFLCFFTTAFFYFPKYWQQENFVFSDDITHGITEDGNPWIGAEKPELTIVEYADYMCFQCKKMHFYLRELINKYPDKIRLVHKHFPMDKKVNPLVKEDFHTGSGKMSLVAIYAASKGKFWQVSDYLFSLHGNFNLKKLGEKVGISPAEFVWALESKEIRYFLNKDLSDGLKLGITGTPSYEIEGKVYTGVIPPEILDLVIAR